jgi:hypothetical protein
MDMTLLRRHIATVLILAVFSLMMHVGVYHGHESEESQAQEQDHGHISSDTCIAGLAHAQLSLELVAPTATWVPVAVVPSSTSENYHQNSPSKKFGRAPPSVNTAVTS